MIRWWRRNRLLFLTATRCICWVNVGLFRTLCHVETCSSVEKTNNKHTTLTCISSYASSIVVTWCCSCNAGSSQKKHTRLLSLRQNSLTFSWSLHGYVFLWALRMASSGKAEYLSTMLESLRLGESSGSVKVLLHSGQSRVPWCSCLLQCSVMHLRQK